MPAFPPRAPQQPYLTLTQTQTGPLPSPEVLHEYDVVVPGAAERIMRMAEAQAAHRQLMERAAIDSQVQDVRAQRMETRLGQLLGFILCLVLVGGAVAIGLRGYQWAASIMGGGSVATLASVFILGRRLPPPEEKPQKQIEKK